MNKDYRFNIKHFELSFANSTLYKSTIIYNRRFPYCSAHYNTAFNPTCTIVYGYVTVYS